MASISFCETSTDGADLSTYTFSAQTLGTEAYDRHIIVGTVSRDSSNNTSITSVTVAGVTATAAITRGVNDAGNSVVVGLHVAFVPTGTTGDVVVVLSTTMLRCGICVWSAYGINPTAHATNGVGGTNPNPSLNVPAGGICASICSNGQSTATATWTNITEVADIQVGGEVFRLYAASDTFATAQTPLSITVTPTTSSAPQAVAASWEALFTPKAIIF